jgi:hypothetical protein
MGQLTRQPEVRSWGLRQPAVKGIISEQRQWLSFPHKLASELSLEEESLGLNKGKEESVRD